MGRKVSQNPWSSRTKFLILIGFWILVGGIYLTMRPLSLDREAERSLQASIDGNAGYLFKHMFEEEKEKNDYTVEKVDRLWSELILPRYVGLRQRGPITSEVLSQSQGKAEVELVTDGIQPYPRGASVWKTDRGPRILIGSELLLAYDVEHIVKKGKAFTVRNMIEARLAGLRQDRNTLDAIGIKYFVSLDPLEGEFTSKSIDESIASLQAALQKNLAATDQKTGQ